MGRHTWARNAKACGPEGPKSGDVHLLRASRPSLDPRFACFQLRIAHSRIDRYGVYACEPIPRGRKVIEYTGKRASRRGCRPRLHRRDRRRDLRRTYLISVNRRWVLDGAAGGSGAEFINHSCEPNLHPRTFCGHVLLFSVRNIRRGEELTWDYKAPKDEEHTPCRCRSPFCRGTLNLC